MKRQTVITQKKRGPPATGKGELIGVRLQPEILQPLDQWIADQHDPQPTRPEAVRKALQDWLTGLGLISVEKSTRSNQRGRKKSADMAGKTIDALTDQSALAEDQDRRKRRLLKGPKEFRDVRKGHSKSRRPKE